MIFKKQDFRLPLFFILLLANLYIFAENGTSQKDSVYISGISLNKNRFFRFNNDVTLTFDVSLQKGYDQYLEYLVRITDINKQEVNVILSIENNVPSEILIISKDKLSKRTIGISKKEFQDNAIPFRFLVDLKSDQLTIGVRDTVLVENRLGLRPHADYKIVLGVDNKYKTVQNTSSSLKLSNLSSDPDLLEQKDIAKGESSTLLWIIIIVILDILIFGYIILMKRKLKKQRNKELEETGSEEIDDIMFHPEMELNEVMNINKGAIFLFKQFEVLDKDSTDISFRFTPLLKELFLLLLLYSQKDSKGINTGLLKDILWFDKEQQSANNNRAVNIGKLKSILDKVGGYQIISVSSNIRIEIKEDIYCDYTRVLSLLYNKSLNKEQILELVAIVRRGAFLPECSYEWLDSFKVEISDKLIDNLLNMAELANIKDDNKLLVQIADTIFNLDDLNEKALIIKCTALINMGKSSIANISYNRFVKDYENVYGIPYPLLFSDIMKTNKS